MSHLRRKLEVGGAPPGTISSIPAVGYVFRRTSENEAETSSPVSVGQREAGSAA